MLYLQDDSNGLGAYIKEWNLDIPKPTMAQLDAFEAQATVVENNQQNYCNKKIFIWFLGNSTRRNL
jgi:hypothetical protein